MPPEVFVRSSRGMTILNGLLSHIPLKFGARSVDLAFISVIWLVTMAVLGFLLFSLNRGLDISDEAFAYMSIQDPFSFQFALRFQGFLLHPLDQLFGGSLIAIRAFGLLFSASLFGLVIWLSKDIFGRDRSEFKTTLAAIIAATSLVGLDRLSFLVTPTYITVATWGYCGFVMGWIFFRRSMALTAAQRWSHLSLAGFFIAIGGLSAFLARPPTGAALFAVACAAFLPLLLFRAQEQKAVFQVTVISSVFLVAILMVLSITIVTPIHIWTLLENGLEVRSRLETTQPFIARHIEHLVWVFDTKGLDQLHIVSVSAFSVLVSLVCTRLTGRLGKIFTTLNILLTVGIFIAAFYKFTPFSLFQKDYYIRTFGFDIWMLASVWLALSTAYTVWRDRRLPSLFGVALLCYLGPLAIVFGTGSTLYVQIGQSTSLFGLSIILISYGMKVRYFGLASSAFVTVLAASTLFYGTQAPYRLNGSIMMQTQNVELMGLGGEVIKFDPDTARFYKKLQKEAVSHGLKPGVQLLDLTGRRPGINLILGTRAPVYPWIASGYVNSGDILDTVWYGIEEQNRTRTWLLAPVHDSFISARALANIGVLEDRYELVVSLVEPRTGKLVELWKPKS